MHFRAIAIAKMLLPWHYHCNNIQMSLQLPRYVPMQLPRCHGSANAIAKMIITPGWPLQRHFRFHCRCQDALSLKTSLPWPLSHQLMVARLDFVIRGSGDLVSLRRETMQDLLPQAQNHCQTDMSRITF